MLSPLNENLSLFDTPVFCGAARGGGGVKKLRKGYICPCIMKAPLLAKKPEFCVAITTTEWKGDMTGKVKLGQD